MILNIVFTSIRRGLLKDIPRSGNPCRWSIPVHFRRGKRPCKRNDRLKAGVERRKKPCCVRTGLRSIGCLVGNIDTNGHKGPVLSQREGPVLSKVEGPVLSEAEGSFDFAPLRSGRTGSDTPFTLSVGLLRPKSKGQDEREGANPFTLSVGLLRPESKGQDERGDEA